MQFWRLRPEKKDTVVCWQEIGSFLVVVGNFHYDRKKKDTLRPEKKKDTVVCLNSESEFQQPAVWNEVINQVKNYGM